MHVTNIKKYKNMFEKWDMWDFAYFDGKEYYFLTLYEQFLKGITGYLILDAKGNVVPFNRSTDPAYFLVSYNTMIHETMKQMVPQMYKDMSPFKDVLSLLRKNKWEIVNSCTRCEPSINKIIEYTTISLENPKRIKDIVYTLGGYQNQIQDETGFFDKDFYDLMQDESGKYSEIMYMYGLREMEMIEDYQTIIDAISGTSSIPKIERIKLKGLLKASIQSNKDALSKSMETFNRDIHGKKIIINIDNMKEALEKNKDEHGMKAFEEKIVPKIRNPK